ncbi:MAG: response regulator [Sandaracinus sp.]
MSHTDDPSLPDASRPHIVVVEDDPETQSELARALGDAGARVVGTGSGEAALALLEEWPAGLVVVSDGIAGMGGLEVARRIHASSPKTAIVLMSERPGAGDETVTEKKALDARLAGVFAMLTKPFDRRMLAELVVALVAATDLAVG